MLTTLSFVILQAVSPVVEQAPNFGFDELAYVLMGFASTVILALVGALTYVYLKKETDKDKFIESIGGLKEQIGSLAISIANLTNAANKQAEAADRQSQDYGHLRDKIIEMSK